MFKNHLNIIYLYVLLIALIVDLFHCLFLLRKSQHDEIIMKLQHNRKNMFYNIQFSKNNFESFLISQN